MLFSRNVQGFVCRSAVLSCFWERGICVTSGGSLFPCPARQGCSEVCPELSLCKGLGNKFWANSGSVPERVTPQKFNVGLYQRVSDTFKIKSCVIVTDTSSILPTDSVDFIFYFSFMMEYSAALFLIYFLIFLFQDLPLKQGVSALKMTCSSLLHRLETYFNILWLSTVPSFSKIKISNNKRFNWHWMWIISILHWGFHYFRWNGFYTITSPAEAMKALFTCSRLYELTLSFKQADDSGSY